MFGLTKPVIIFAIVDFPDPDSPTKPKVSPSNNSNDTLSTALTTLSFNSFFELNEKILVNGLSSNILVILVSFNSF